jgi:hypothetical protein
MFQHLDLAFSELTVNKKTRKVKQIATKLGKCLPKAALITIMLPVRSPVRQGSQRGAQPCNNRARTN